MFSKEKIFRLGKFLAKLAITFAALYLVSRQIDLNALKALFFQSQIAFLILALALFIVAKLLEARRSNIFFRAIDIHMSEAMNTRLYSLGMFYNLFLPGGIGGDSYRVYWLKKKFQTSLKSLILAFLLNRVNGLLALVSLLLISGIYVSHIHPLLSYAFLLIPIGLAGYYLVLRRFFERYTKTAVPSTAYSFLIQLFQLASAHFVLYSFGIDQNFGAYWFIFLLSGIAFIIPITVGGVGSRELVFLYGADLLAVDLNSCIALSLVIYCMRAFVSLVGIYFMMYPGKIGDKP